MSTSQMILLLIFSVVLLFSIAMIGILFLGLRMMVHSTFEAIRLVFAMATVAVVYPISFLSSIVRYIGNFIPMSEIYSSAFKIYPGHWFADKFREDFVDQGSIYLEEGFIHVENERDYQTLLEHIQQTHEFSGKAISDGEAVIALTIAFVGLLSTVPGWTSTLLSIVLIVAVAARVTTMESLLFDVPEDVTDSNRLEAILGWNEGIVNSGPLFRTTLILRIMYDVDSRFYDQYLYRVMHQTFINQGVNRKDTVDTFLPAFLIISESRMRGVDAESLSEEKYGRNVLELPVVDGSENNERQ